MTVVQRDAILNSVTKLTGTIIDIDESDINAVFNYDKDREPITRSAILPAYLVKKS